MQKILNIIEDVTGGKSNSTFKYSFDRIGIPAIQYDWEPDRVMKWKDVGETATYKAPIDLTSSVERLANENIEPLIKYFLDGSRHVYKVDDMTWNNRVYPIVAGQIGVGCCARENKKIYPYKYTRKFIISLPDKSHTDEWNDDAYFNAALKSVNENSRLKKLGIEFSAIIPYSTNIKMSPTTKLEDKAIAKIQDAMTLSEKEMVSEMVKEGCLGSKNYLLKDGSLEYKTMSSGNKDYRELQKYKHNYQWVVGVSKSFNPESCADHTGKPNSRYISELPLFHRTPVSRFENPIFLGDTVFGVWYVRLRDKKYTLTPFDGVLKVEKILMDEELDNGLDSELVDWLTAQIINERNPVCYGTDKRWANHLYPVYATEQYVKSQYMSEQMFLQLF